MATVSPADFQQLLELLSRSRKDIHIMAEVQLSVTFNVAPAPAALAVTPTSVTQNLQVGVVVPATPIAQVTGGVAPYEYALDANSGPLPPGVTFSEDGNGNIFLVGTPTAAGTSPSPVILDITDSAGASAQVKVNPAVLRPITATKSKS